MSQPTVSVHELRWNELCPWLILVKALRVSLMVRVLLLAWAGVMLTQWGWMSLYQVTLGEGDALPKLMQPATFSVPPSVSSQSWTVENSREPGGPILIVPDTTRGLEKNDELGLKKKGLSVVGEYRYGTLYRAWEWISDPILRIFTLGRGWKPCLVLGLCGVWAIVVWGLVGGAISRIAALHLARSETLGLLAALRAALPKWTTLIVAPLIPLGFAALLGVPILLAGLLLRFDMAAILVGLVWGVALVLGAVLAVVLIGLMIGWPFIWATVGVERTDALDGVSRSYSYVYQRPLHLVFYWFVASVLGFFGEKLLQWLADATKLLTQWTASWGAGNERIAELMAPPAEVAGTATRAIELWHFALDSFVASYPMALLWPMAVGIYLLMRRHIDSTEMEEISLDEGQPAESLPPLEPHESGVPEVKR